MTTIARWGLAVLLTVSLCSACVGLPDNGQVNEVGNRTSSSQDSGFPYDPPAPQKGEEATEIVGHFLNAMLANPTTTSVAKQFLSERARETWRPDRELITYDDILTPRGSNEVAVTLLNAHHLDARGTWRGELAAERRTLDFAMTVEDGEWRIDDPPDAMIVSDEFFEARYRQVSLYYLDPTAEIVVPEPVFVPRGGQLSAVLMRALLLGPAPRLRGVTRSFIPEDLTLDLSAPVSEAGVAEVSLRGEATTLDPETLELMTVQIAWTLRQDPSVRRVRLTINDTPVKSSGESSDFVVEVGAEYDPVGTDVSLDMFTLHDSRMVTADGAETSRVAGPFGERDYGLGKVSVNVDGSIAAAVTDDGSSVLMAPVDTDAGEPDEVVSGATDLLKPVWDAAGRLWLVDRTREGARVSYVFKGKQHRVRVPGISGRQVSSFLVSRDGTRLIGVLDRARGDVVAQSRLALEGTQLTGTRAQVIHRDLGEKVQIRDIGWYSPTEVVMARTITDELSQVSTFSVDGSRAVQSDEVPSELVRDDVVDLVSSPDATAATWAISASGKVYELSAESIAAPPAVGLRSLTYVG